MRWPVSCSQSAMCRSIGPTVSGCQVAERSSGSATSGSRRARSVMGGGRCVSALGRATGTKVRDAACRCTSVRLLEASAAIVESPRGSKPRLPTPSGSRSSGTATG